MYTNLYQLLIAQHLLSTVLPLALISYISELMSPWQLVPLTNYQLINFSIRTLTIIS